VRLDPARTALLVIDLQNDTVGEDGVERVALVTDAFRAAGAAATISDEFQRAALDYAPTTVANRATAEDVIAALA